MRFKRVLCFFTVLILLGSTTAFAEEGMWQLDRLDGELMSKMKGLGLKLSGDEIYEPGGGGIAYAIVDLGGGTGSFVSDRGLILTNHHVAFTALQRTSSVESNFIEEGFYADSYDKEIQAPGYEASILISIQDVTDSVLDAAEGLEGIERFEAIEDRIKEIVKENEEGRDVECRVSGFFGGMKYKLFTYFTMKDVRIVYAPPKSIGNYGGDIDNWMWPRHTGDFSFFRAYVAPDGSSAEYSEENVPYQPEVHLAMSMKGIKKDDFTMIIGFPGRTMRYRTSYSIRYSQNWMYPLRIRVFGELIDLFQREAEKNPAVAIKVASFDQMLNNAMKNYQGMLEGFQKSRLLEKKIADEKKFTGWLSENEKMDSKYGSILPSIEALYRKQESYRDKNFVLRFSGFGCQMLRASGMLVRWSMEKEKPDLERDSGFLERDIPQLKRSLRMIQMSYDESVDKAALRYFLKKSQELPENQRIEGFDSLLAAAEGENVDARIDNAIEKLYAGTSLDDLEERLRLFESPGEEIRKTDDSFIKFALTLEKEKKKLRDLDKDFGGRISALRPELIRALRKWKSDELFYPDANSTIRLTYGTVRGYSPEKGVEFDYITSLSGVVKKHTGEKPFDCPDKLLEIHKQGTPEKYIDEYLDDVPVDFLSTCDITGGNSGSPILNGKGEVIGAAFDGNYESISADYQFDEGLTRAISVDSRYILFILEEFSGAKSLLDEMTIH
ncbi:MAG: S46 family peptidase [Candidatus Krumholzibacteriota bacterium]